MSKKRMFFSEKIKLEEEYLKWCEEQNKEIHGGKIDEKNFVNVITFLQSIGWGNIKELESENAALRARLDKAVELPCKVGDTVYKVYGECNGSDCPYNGAFGQWRCNYKGKDRCKAFIDTRAFRYSDISSINKTIFVSKEAAESRLAELKGEKK